jgi:hypothetical protein
MSEAHLKLFINDLYYVASLPIKTTMRTISYYTNLSEELETDKALISSLKTELKLKEDIISIQDITLETERNLYEELEKERSLTASLKKELEQSKNTNRCYICYENKISKCCFPCGHVYCDMCIAKTNKCYICRNDILSLINIYL